MFEETKNNARFPVLRLRKQSSPHPLLEGDPSPLLTQRSNSESEHSTGMKNRQLSMHFDYFSIEATYKTEIDPSFTHNFHVETADPISVIPIASKPKVPMKLPQKSNIEAVIAIQTVFRTFIQRGRLQNKIKTIKSLKAKLMLNSLLEKRLFNLSYHIKKHFDLWASLKTSDRFKQLFLNYSATFIQKIWKGFKCRKQIYIENQEKRHLRTLLLAAIKGWKTRRIIKSKRFKTQVKIIRDMLELLKELQDSDPLLSQIEVKIPLAKEKLANIFEDMYRRYQNPKEKMKRSEIRTLPLSEIPQVGQYLRRESRPSHTRQSIRHRSVRLEDENKDPVHSYLRRKSRPVKARKLNWNAKCKVDCWNGNTSPTKKFPEKILPDFQQKRVPDSQERKVHDFQQRKVPDFQQKRVPDFQQKRVPDFQQKRVPDFQRKVPDFQQRKEPDFQQRKEPDFQQRKVPDFQQRKEPDFQQRKEPDFQQKTATAKIYIQKLVPTTNKRTVCKKEMKIEILEDLVNSIAANHVDALSFFLDREMKNMDSVIPRFAYDSAMVQSHTLDFHKTVNYLEKAYSMLCNTRFN